MSWLLPPLFFWVGIGSHWTQIWLLFPAFAVTAFVAFGLLGSLPRFILRKRGARRTPGAVTWLLFVQWWGWLGASLVGVGVALFGPGFGIETIPAGLSQMLSTTAMILILTTWCTVLVLAIVTPVADPPRRRWQLAAGVTAVALPISFVAVATIGLAHASQQVDTAGDSVAAVHQTPIRAQADRVEERFEAFHQHLSEVRALVADSAWHEFGRGMDDGDACNGHGASCYRFTTEFTHETAGAQVDLATLVAGLHGPGWNVEERRDWNIEPGTAVTAFDDGLVVEIAVTPGGEIQLDAASQWWWGDRFELVDALGGYEPCCSPSGPFAADEWRPLL